MCMQHFFIRVEKVITSQGNENRSHLGHKLLLTAIKKFWGAQNRKKCNQWANNNEKTNNVCDLTIYNFLKQTYYIKMSNLLPSSHLVRLYGYSFAQKCVGILPLKCLPKLI